MSPLDISTQVLVLQYLKEDFLKHTVEIHLILVMCQTNIDMKEDLGIQRKTDFLVNISKKNAK